MSPQSGRVDDDERNIRQFTQQRFNDSELRDFCLAYFPQVHDEFTIGMTRSQMVYVLIDYCRRHEQMPDLMAALQRERPEQFHQYFSWQARQFIPTPQPYTPKQRNPKQIFLSHAHQDAEFAQKLAKDLKSKGWDVWIAPDSIRPGERWIEAINRGLEESSILLLVVTPEAVNSKWVRREVGVAIEMQHEGLMRVIPLDVKAATVPPLWRSYQRISFRNGYKTGQQQLLQTLELPKDAVVQNVRPEKKSKPSEQNALRMPSRPQEKASSPTVPFAERLRGLPPWAVPAGAAVFLLIIAAIWLPQAFSVAENSDEPTATITRESSGAGGGVVATAETTLPTSETGQAAATIAQAVETAAVESASEPSAMLATATIQSTTVNIPRATPTITPTPPPQAGDKRVLTLPSGLEVTQVFVPAGSFLMGSAEHDSLARDDEKPQHQVTLDSFWIDQTEVTNRQFAAFLNESGNQQEGGVTRLEVESSYSLIEVNDGRFQPKVGFEEHPVIEVSWYGAYAYCEWTGGRLPTEAEWEYAARGPYNRLYPWGNSSPVCDLVNYNWCVSGVTKVGSYPDGASWSNALDMSGNVWEWVIDWYDVGYYRNSPQENPIGPESGTFRVIRGGSWYQNHQFVRTAIRNNFEPTERLNGVGLRCVQEWR